MNLFLMQNMGNFIIIKFLQIIFINFTVFQLLIKMGKLSLLKYLILLFFSKLCSRKHLPGSDRFKFEFSKIFQDLH